MCGCYKTEKVEIKKFKRLLALCKQSVYNLLRKVDRN